MPTVAILLATDAGDGFAGPKYLTDVGGVPLIERAVSESLAWNVTDRVVVVGPDAEAVSDAIGTFSVTTLIDPEWEEGTSSPIRAALDLVTRDRSVTHCLFVRADQSDHPSGVVDELLRRAEASGADAVVPKYRYARGWPVVIGQHLFERLLGAEGDVDLLNVISMHADSIEECWFDRISPSRVSEPGDAT